MAKNTSANRNISVEQQAAQMKRSLTFFILILMVMSLTVCNNPSRELIDNGTYLTLVNPTHKLPDNWLNKIELVTAQNSLGEEFQGEKETLSHFEDLRNELLEEGIDIELDSAYRTEEEQQEIWDAFSERYGDDVGKYAAKPGYSEHQTGLAADIADHDRATYLTQEMEDTPEGIWLRNHAHEYGFIMRYPKGKEEITGYAYEPWHFRYVGRDYAAAIYNVDEFCSFEEYFGVEGGDYYE